MSFSLRRLIAKPGWAVIDQGSFALSNFALNLLLARWLSPTDYGIFTVAYTGILLAATFHTATLTEPMLVFGPGKYRNRLSSYLGTVLFAHWLGMGVLGFLFLWVGIVLSRTGQQYAASTVWLLSLTGPLILFLWLMRRACYARMAPHLAGYAGAIYLFLMVAHIVVLYWTERLSVSLAFVVLASTSFLVGMWLVHRLQIGWPTLKGNGLFKEIRMDHWNYGRWSVMTGVLMWVPGQIVYFLLPFWFGLEECAGLRALVNLIMPYMLLCTALGTVLTPSLVNAQGQPNFQILITKYLFPLVAGGLLYWLCINLFSSHLIAWMYNGRYVEYAPLLWVLGILPIFGGIVAVFGAALRSLQQPALIFWSYVWSTTIALTIGVGLVFTWGMAGGVVALTISYAISASVMVILYCMAPTVPGREHTNQIAWA